MSAVALAIDLDTLRDAELRLGAIEAQIHMPTLMVAVTAIAESQTRRRIAQEKTAPDGTPWAAWSPEYARTRHGGHSLLQSDDNLLEGIFGEVRGDDGVVGSDMVYAAAQQFGIKTMHNDGELPARPFLGISNDNGEEILDEVVAYIESLPL